jgi:general stress protein 26
MQEQAEERFWQILDQAEVALFITNGPGGFPHSRPMTLLAYEEDGILWFATSRSSRKVKEIKRDSKVTVCFVALEEGAHAQAFGRAELLDDPELKRELWEDEWLEYWDGPEDPDLVLLAVYVERAEYYLIDEDELWVIDFS